MNAGLHVGTVLVGCLSLACGKLSFFRALAVLHKTDSTPRSAGPVPGPRSPLACPVSSTYLPAWHRETCQSQSSRDREGNGPDRWGYPSGPDGGAPGDAL